MIAIPRYLRLAAALSCTALLVSACVSEPDQVPTATVTETPTTSTVVDEPKESQGLSGQDLLAIEDRAAKYVIAENLWIDAGGEVVEALATGLGPWDRSGCSPQDLPDGDEECAKLVPVLKISVALAKVKWTAYSTPEGEFYTSDFQEMFEESIASVTQHIDFALDGTKTAIEVCPTHENCSKVLEYSLDSIRQVHDGLSEWQTNN